jgi:hypothetical protein
MPSAGESRAADRINQTLQRKAKGDEAMKAIETPMPHAGSAMKLFYGGVMPL